MCAAAKALRCFQHIVSWCQNGRTNTDTEQATCYTCTWGKVVQQTEGNNCSGQAHPAIELRIRAITPWASARARSGARSPRHQARRSRCLLGWSFHRKLPAAKLSTGEKEVPPWGRGPETRRASARAKNSFSPLRAHIALEAMKTCRVEPPHFQTFRKKPDKRCAWL